MLFQAKINNGILKQGSYFIQLSDDEKEKLNHVTSYNELLQIKESLSSNHKLMVSVEKLQMRDDIQVYQALNSGKIIKAINSNSRGCFKTITFQA